MTLEIKLHGVRGSLPTPYYPPLLNQKFTQALTQFRASDSSSGPEKFLQDWSAVPAGGYGGNTTCVQVKSPQGFLLIDGGTGIRNSLEECANQGLMQGQGEVHIFFTHFHWDHLIGLPFFPPMYMKGNKIHFYAVQKDLQDVIRTIFRKPFFPVSFEMLQSEIYFHTLAPRVPFAHRDMVITPYRLDHPDPCWGFRIQNQGKVYAHCVDTEATRTSEKELAEDRPLYQDVDLMLFDAQYSIEEANIRKNWGHAPATKGLELAAREQVKKIVFVHHDPMADDHHISMIAQESYRFFNQQQDKLGIRPKLEWEIGQEGMVFKL